MSFESVYGTVPFSSYLVLPEGVTSNVSSCTCGDVDCFYCTARQDAMMDAAWADEYED